MEGNVASELGKKKKRFVFNDEGLKEEKDLSPPPPTKKRKLLQEKQQGRPWTVSVALPGSIIQNAQTLELRTYLAGQVGRCLAIFNIDEVIIFDEPSGGTDKAMGQSTNPFNPCHFLARLLQYQECPQYLRKSFFPVHKDLKLAGLLNPLDAPHHMRVEEWNEFREGVVLPKHQKKAGGSYVNVGLYQNAYVEKKIRPNTRVTLRFSSAKKTGKYYQGEVVSPHTPREERGLYWGYNTRLAKNISSVFSQCPFPDGYDLKIGTSEKGKDFEDLGDLPDFHHLLIVFGGVKGLEESVASDENIDNEDPSVLFDEYINTCPNQGSRTIRTEEAMLLTLSLLRPKIALNNF